MKKIFKSVRFQQMAVATILALLISEGYLGEGVVELIAQMVSLVAGISAGVGTVDRFSEKIGNNK